MRPGSPVKAIREMKAHTAGAPAKQTQLLMTHLSLFGESFFLSHA